MIHDTSYRRGKNQNQNHSLNSQQAPATILYIIKYISYIYIYYINIPYHI